MQRYFGSVHCIYVLTKYRITSTCRYGSVALHHETGRFHMPCQGTSLAGVVYIPSCASGKRGVNTHGTASIGISSQTSRYSRFLLDHHLSRLLNQTKECVGGEEEIPEHVVLSYLMKGFGRAWDNRS